jgi:hypothetical protein
LPEAAPSRRTRRLAAERRANWSADHRIAYAGNHPEKLWLLERSRLDAVIAGGAFNGRILQSRELAREEAVDSSEIERTGR